MEVRIMGTNSLTRLVVPCRISFANIWEPKGVNGSEPKYSVSCLVSKKDKATLEKIGGAIEAAKEDGKTRKWGGKTPTNLKLPLHDGDVDRPDDEAYKKWYSHLDYKWVLTNCESDLDRVISDLTMITYIYDIRIDIPGIVSGVLR